jgi:hypothetical protein
MIIKCDFKDGTTLPTFINEDDLLSHGIVDHDEICKFLRSDWSKIESFYFSQNNSRCDACIDLRNFTINRDNLREYLLEKVNKELDKFSFPQIGSYEYLIAVIGQKNISKNMYVKQLIVVQPPDEIWQDEYYDPYADE